MKCCTGPQTRMDSKERPKQQKMVIRLASWLSVVSVGQVNWVRSKYDVNNWIRFISLTKQGIRLRFPQISLLTHRLLPLLSVISYLTTFTPLQSFKSVCKFDIEHVFLRQYLFINWSVDSTTFTIKQNKHYCANICFYACVVIPLHVSTLLLGHPQVCSIQALVTELLWFHTVYMTSF
jgi:hypothetical protein